MEILFACLFMAVPAMVLILMHHQAWAGKAGAVILCYATGLIVGNSGLLPADGQAAAGLVAQAGIAIGLPMTLFSLDVRHWITAAPRALISMALAVTAVSMLATCLYLLYRDSGLGNVHELSAMAVGVYSGGTPNMAAIKTALSIEDNRYLVVHSFDTVLGAVYLLFMMTLGRSLFSRLLPHTTSAQSDDRNSNTDHEDMHHQSHSQNEDYREFLTRDGLVGLGKTLAAAILVVGVALGLAAATGQFANDAVVIILLTSAGIAASFIPAVRRIRQSYKAGMYLIYAFSFAVASMADLETLKGLDFRVLIFFSVALVGGVALHALFCRLFKVDAGTFIVTSVAAVCSPPFVPMLARSLGSPSLLLSGMTTGVMGYAFGTYLGIGLASLLQNMG